MVFQTRTFPYWQERDSWMATLARFLRRPEESRLPTNPPGKQALPARTCRGVHPNAVVLNPCVESEKDPKKRDPLVQNVNDAELAANKASMCLFFFMHRYEKKTKRAGLSFAFGVRMIVRFQCVKRGDFGTMGRFDGRKIRRGCGWIFGARKREGGGRMVGVSS